MKQSRKISGVMKTITRREDVNEGEKTLHSSVLLPAVPCGSAT